jgi:gamma-glutamyl phosphate reductase
MDDDSDELRKLGTRRKKLLAELDDITTKMKPLIIAANAKDVAQVKIMEMTGYSGETIRKLCLPPDQAAQEAEARKERRRKKDPAG